MIEENYSSQVLTKQSTLEGFCSINSEIVTDVTNSSNVLCRQIWRMLAPCFSMDRLLASVTLRFFACKQNRIAVSPMWMEVGWEFGERFCSRQWADTLFYHHSAWVCLTSSMSLHLKCNPAYFGLRCLFDLDCRNMQLGVICKRNWSEMECSSNECSQRFCVQNEYNRSQDRALRNAKVEQGWLWKFVVDGNRILLER